MNEKLKKTIAIILTCHFFPFCTIILAKLQGDSIVSGYITGWIVNGTVALLAGFIFLLYYITE